MKRIILAILMVLLISGCSGTNESGWISSDAQTVLNKIANKESFLVLIDKNDCYSCEMLKEDLNDCVSENKLDIQVINDYDISDSNRDQLQIALGKNSSWPVLYYVKEGSVSELLVYEYSLDPEGWKQWLIDMKLISK